MRLMWLAVCGVLIGCTPAVTVDQIDAVSWGNRGSIIGQATTTLRADDSFLIVVSQPDGSLRRSQRQAPEGSFDAISQTAVAQLAQLATQAEVEPCLDYGSDFLELRRGADVLDRAEASCTGSALNPVIKELNAMLRARIEGVAQ